MKIKKDGICITVLTGPGTYARWMQGIETLFIHKGYEKLGFMSRSFKATALTNAPTTENKGRMKGRTEA